MKGYKAFKKGMICDPTGKKPFQFAENTEYEVDGEKIKENALYTLKNGEFTEIKEDRKNEDN